MFTQISAASFESRIFSLIKNQWFCITATDNEHINPMTAAWGSLGVMWNRPVFTVVVRNTRHTFSLLEKSDSFSCSFFPKEYRDVLTYCGRHSGRDVDKIKETGLTVHHFDSFIGYEEADLVFCCRKASRTLLSPDQFIDDTIIHHYEHEDYHIQYMGYIEKIYRKEV
ncbi:MAG: hypothetical protein PQJ47_03925 [Sphaerochaetaceae bacterium]|nr:hypothetical protein [Sphaerochaetaceae bacterium]MDC7246883.1 hypothetical protein [Sphaerochaetaceae bacterium]